MVVYRKTSMIHMWMRSPLSGFLPVQWRSAWLEQVNAQAPPSKATPTPLGSIIWQERGRTLMVLMSYSQSKCRNRVKSQFLPLRTLVVKFPENKKFSTSNKGSFLREGMAVKDVRLRIKMLPNKGSRRIPRLQNNLWISVTQGIATTYRYSVGR